VVLAEARRLRQRDAITVDPGRLRRAVLSDEAALHRLVRNLTDNV
jgi:hypothetical protein